MKSTRGRPRRPKKAVGPPPTSEELTVMTEEFLANGGKITRIDDIEEIGALKYGKRDSIVAKQLPWLRGAVSEVRREEREIREVGFDG